MTVDLNGGLSNSGEFVLAERPQDPEMRDAVNVWIESADGRFGMRIGIEALAKDWDAHDIWLDIAFADGRVISFRESHRPLPAIDQRGQATIRGAGPLAFRCITPFRHWTASFSGMAPATTAESLARGLLDSKPGLVEVEFDIDMTMAAPPWAPGSLSSAARDILSGKQGEFMSHRYEQLFNARGSLRLGASIIELAGTGLRIRRQGVRRLEGFRGHCWQSALFPSGRAFGVISYPPLGDGQAGYNEGYLYEGSGELKAARAIAIPWLDRLLTSGDNVSFVLETAEGTVAVAGTTFINTRSVNKGRAVLPADFPIVQQAHARYQWDGEEGCGMIERSATPDRISQ